MNPGQFIQSLRELNFENVFNPYSDHCPIHDCINASHQRANTLLGMLEAAKIKEIDSLWIGRDLGYRGGRRTGLALTDDVHLEHHAARWGVSIKRPTKGQEVAERTAAVVWGGLAQIDAHVFLWNVFPLHPHEPSNPFTNRSHNALERKAGEELLSNLIVLLKPRRLIAIGNDAAHVTQRVARYQNVVQVRHPSYGGQNVFLRQIKELYGLEDSQSSLL